MRIGGFSLFVSLATLWAVWRGGAGGADGGVGALDVHGGRPLEGGGRVSGTVGGDVLPRAGGAELGAPGVRPLPGPESVSGVRARHGAGARGLGRIDGA